MFADGSEECYNILYEALRMLIFKANTNAFSTTILNHLYHIQKSSVHFATHVKCQHGMVSSNIYCGNALLIQSIILSYLACYSFLKIC